MNRFIQIVIIIVSISSCDTRYREQGPEIEAYKELISGMHRRDYKNHPDIYSDSAKIYLNSTVPLTWKQSTAGLDESFNHFESYAYNDHIEWQMVLNDMDEEWLGMWTIFRATMKNSGESIEVPVHISARFENGKIVEEACYWDNSIILEAIERDTL